MTAGLCRRNSKHPQVRTGVLAGGSVVENRKFLGWLLCCCSHGEVYLLDEVLFRSKAQLF